MHIICVYELLYTEKTRAKITGFRKVALNALAKKGPQP